MKKYSNIKSDEITFSGSRSVPCERTEGNGEANSCFSQFCTRRTAHLGHVVLAAEDRYTAIRVQRQMANSINICLLPRTRYSNIQLSKAY